MHAFLIFAWRIFLHLTCVVGTFLSSGDILIVLHNFKGLSEDWDLVLMLS